MQNHHQPTLPRKLAATLFADVQGYSRMMGRDEDATHRKTISGLRLFEEKIASYGGRIVRSAGDGVLAEMQSAGDAVKYAVEVQKAIAERNLDLPVEDRLEFRIGINLGDVIIEQGEIYGDSVNIADRLQELAYPGGICISRAVHEQVKTSFALGFEYLGRQELKNILQPVEVYRVRHDPKSLATLPTFREESKPLEVPARPSIAVLPFRNLSENQREYFLADGVTDDIIIALSKFRELFVIARDSAFVYKLRPSGARESAAKELGVRYLVEGSVRREGDRLRVNTQLIDSESGREIWGERYDHPFGEIFAVMDDLTVTIACALARHIDSEERRRAQQAKTNNLESYGLVLKGQELLFRHEERANVLARKHYETAAELDPHYARAYAAISRTFNFDWRYSWSEDAAKSLDQALEFAKQAIHLDEFDARGYSELGFVNLYKKEHDASIAAYERAIQLNPNDADVLAEMGDALSYAGEDERAVELLKHAIRLNPFYPDWYLWYLGEAYFHLGNFEDAIKTLRKMRNPSEGHRLLASSYAHLGEMKEARHHATQVMKVHPNFSVAHWRTVPPYKHKEQLEVFIEGLRKAGLK